MTPTRRERAEVHCIDQEGPVGSVLRPRSAGEIFALILMDEPLTMRCSAVRRGHGEGRDGGKRGGASVRSMTPRRPIIDAIASVDAPPYADAPR
jgi:hypothetical protein